MAYELAESSDTATRTGLNERLLFEWLTLQPRAIQKDAAEHQFQKLLKAACQPRDISGNACIRLCYFLEQCHKSASPDLLSFACSYSVCLNLFRFYLEWNEKNQHRSMRQVLELLGFLISKNSNATATEDIKPEILKRFFSIIGHQSAQPLVKPAFKALECFLSKSIISVTELLDAYKSHLDGLKDSLSLSSSIQPPARDRFVAEVFDWMSLPDTSPAAGKLLVTLFQQLKETLLLEDLNRTVMHTTIWQRWIRTGLSDHPDSLENIKNYLFPPLFKIDRPGSIAFLDEIAQSEKLESLESRELDAQAFLLLSAIDVGKKLGLVEEPDVRIQRPLKKARKSVQLPARAIASLLSHHSGVVRSSALSVLVSSISPTNPFPVATLDLLKNSLSILHADTDAKFRNDLLSHTKHMIERLRGATSNMTREIKNMSALEQRKEWYIDKQTSSGSGYIQQACEPADNRSVAAELRPNIFYILESHKQFLSWYLSFLSNELVPTSSYQRHITSLKALQILLHSGIMTSTSKLKVKVVGEAPTAWSFTVNIFTPGLIRLLLDLVMNPFEDVRATSISILKLARLEGNVAGLGCTDVHALTEEGSNESAKEQRQLHEGQNTTVPQHLQTANILKILSKFLLRAQDASGRTGRADLADGVARSQELISSILDGDSVRFKFIESLVIDLEARVLMAETDLGQAVLVAPIHGQFASVRLVWEALNQSTEVLQAKSWSAEQPQSQILNNNTVGSWRMLQSRMLRCCERIWYAVKDVLCNDSPEGHLPQSLDELDNLDTKDVLSYSFRAIHESSNLVCEIVSHVRSKFADGSDFLPFELFAASGNLTFEQLASLRHRGAFSTVSLTFARCCQLTQDKTVPKTPEHALLTKWYQGALNCIQKQSSTTRRSAGIPVLVTCILSANALVPSFHEVMSNLMMMARKPSYLSKEDKTNLSQVHAMNCLKEVFKSSMLGKKSEKYLADCLQIAADSLKSDIWAIRNCGLILLRSLIDCLFGTSESKEVTEAGWDGRSIRLSYDRFPALPELLIELLKSDDEGQRIPRVSSFGIVESVFPALDIIRRAGPPDIFREAIYHGVVNHLGSKVWHIRDIAARTTCTLLLRNSWYCDVLALLETCGQSSNRDHGVFLAIKYLLERRLVLYQHRSAGNLTISVAVLIADPANMEPIDNIPALAQKIKEKWASGGFIPMCAAARAAYEDIFVIMLKIAWTISDSSIVTNEPFHSSNFRELLVGQTEFDDAYRSIRDEQSSVGRGNERANITSISENWALLRKTVAIRALYTAALARCPRQFAPILLVVIQTDFDVAGDLLEQLPIVWDVHSTPKTLLIEIADMYGTMCRKTYPASIRAILLHNLTDVLDRLLELHYSPSIGLSLENDEQAILSTICTASPNLLNAEIGISGSILALDVPLIIESNSFEEFSNRLENWGTLLRSAGRAYNVSPYFSLNKYRINLPKDVDTRYAAVKALRTFYSAVHPELLQLPWKNCLVPSLIALYDTLNDDDEGIRNEGARGVAHLTGSQLVPLAAATKFLEWLLGRLGGTEAFRLVILDRIMHGTRSNDNDNDGNSASLEVAAQLERATTANDALFIEEEQNLYVDEVKDAVAWISLLKYANEPCWDGIFQHLLFWALDGVNSMIRLTAVEDGPFGWGSDPRTFAICMRIFLSVKSVFERYYSKTAGESVQFSELATPATQNESKVVNMESQLQESLIKFHNAVDWLLDVGNRHNLHPVLLDILRAAA